MGVLFRSDDTLALGCHQTTERMAQKRSNLRPEIGRISVGRIAPRQRPEGAAMTVGGIDFAAIIFCCAAQTGVDWSRI